MLLAGRAAPYRFLRIQYLNIVILSEHKILFFFPISLPLSSIIRAIYEFASEPRSGRARARAFARTFMRENRRGEARMRATDTRATDAGGIPDGVCRTQWKIMCGVRLCWPRVGTFPDCGLAEWNEHFHSRISDSGAV